MGRINEFLYINVLSIIQAKNFGSNKYIYWTYIKIYRKGQKRKRKEKYKSYKKVSTTF